jgi:hypothetical protein
MLDENTENSQLELAREAGNTWSFEGREMEMFVADGKMKVAVEVTDRKTQEPNGNVLIHSFAWEKNDPFLIRESKLKTTMRRVGRNTAQEMETEKSITANAELYRAVIQEAVMIVPVGNGETREETFSREQMLEFARFYPETASEAIETWLESWHFELIDEETGSFDWMFSAASVVKVFGWLGDKVNPAAAVVLTFKSPPSEKREKYEEEKQRIKTRRISDLNIMEVSESFIKKLQYGGEHLQSVEGVAIGEISVVYTEKLKEKFITLFNPESFADAVDVMHESFVFTKGKAARN